ncbi:MAG: DNRLRE domain-containing protein, partial [Candidatus Korobacteraceae bacterium]
MRRFVLLLVGSLLCSAVVLAQAPPAADTYVASGAPNTNYGTNTMLAIQPNVYTFIRFNISGIPTNATVQKAVLRLFVSAPSAPIAGTFSVYQINTSWSELTLTWNNKPALGSVVGSPVSLGSSSYLNFVEVDITSLVQQWVNGTVVNNGIALVTTTSGASYSFDSKEAQAYSHSPELDIAIPGAQGAQGPQGATGAAGTNGQGFNFRSAFSNSTNYNAYDVVTYNGSTYEATVAIAAGGGTPVQNSHWALMAQQGSQGSAGATGPQGATGPTGATGAQGPQGTQGPIGVTGPQGPQGTTGTAGANGQGFNFRNAFSNSTSYNAYDVVTYNGSTYEATVAIAAGQGTPVQNSNWALMAQQGAQGTAGTTGPQGASGPQGPAGANGAQGTQGTQGPIGLTGPQGPQGP